MSHQQSVLAPPQPSRTIGTSQSCDSRTAMAGGQAVPPEAVTLTSHARPSYSERRYPVIPAGAGRRISPQTIQATAIHGPPPCPPSGPAAPSAHEPRPWRGELLIMPLRSAEQPLTPRQQDGQYRAGDRPAELTCHGTPPSCLVPGLTSKKTLLFYSIK